MVEYYNSETELCAISLQVRHIILIPEIISPIRLLIQLGSNVQPQTCYSLGEEIR